MYSSPTEQKPDLYSYLYLHISQWSLFVYILTLLCKKKKKIDSEFSFFVTVAILKSNKVEYQWSIKTIDLIKLDCCLS